MYENLFYSYISLKIFKYLILYFKLNLILNIQSIYLFFLYFYLKIYTNSFMKL